MRRLNQDCCLIYSKVADHLKSKIVILYLNSHTLADTWHAPSIPHPSPFRSFSCTAYFWHVLFIFFFLFITQTVVFVSLLHFLYDIVGGGAPSRADLSMGKLTPCPVHQCVCVCLSSAQTNISLLWHLMADSYSAAHRIILLFFFNPKKMDLKGSQGN